MDWNNDSVGGRDKREYLSDLADTLELTAEHKAVRMIGPSKMIAIHKIEIFTPKKPKGVKIPKMCLAFDSETKEFDKGPCPYCDIDASAPAMHVLTNVIDREEQENEPSNKRSPSDKEKKVVEMHGHKCRIKDGKKSKTWTPCRLWEIKPSAGGKISTLAKMNKGKDKDGKVAHFPPQHPKHGFDMQVNFDKDKPGTDMYGVLKDEKTQISEDERKYLLWDLDIQQPEDLKTAKREAESLAKKMKTKVDGDEDDEDDRSSKKSNKSSEKKKPKKGSAEDDDWDSDEDFDDDSDDEDEDEKPAKKKVKNTDKKKKKPDPDEDEDDEDEDEDGVPWDDDDEEEDEKPAKKKKKVKEESKSSKKKKRPDPDEDDEDEEDDDSEDEDEEDDEEEDEKPARKKKKVVDKKKKKRPDPEDDDDNEDWDD